MKIDQGHDKDPYKELSDFLNSWILKMHFPYGVLIVDIRTSVLGEARIVASPYFGDGECQFSFNYDWYEGGDLEILGITPIDDFEAKYDLRNRQEENEEMGKLKKCPWCGSEAEITYHQHLDHAWNDRDELVVLISCKKCNARKESCSSWKSGSHKNPADIWMELQSKAIEKWNERGIK